MKFSFVTLFPETINAYLSVGVLGRAVTRGLVVYDTFNPRDYTHLNHKQVDDRPYGGGSGMVLRADVLKSTIDAINIKYQLDIPRHNRDKVRVVVTAAAGRTFNQAGAKKYTELDHVILIAGRYEGIDQRFIDLYADEVVSVGEYVLSGGELPSLVIADSVSRLIPGVLGNAGSLMQESFSDEMRKEHAHYTRPQDFEGIGVPKVYLSGDHSQIAEVRQRLSEH